MSTLFLVSIGSELSSIAFDTTRDSSFNCTPTTCGNSKYFILEINILWFLIFFVIVNYIILNLFIFILLHNFDEYYLNSDNPI
jgi:hypothetical protein